MRLICKFLNRRNPRVAFEYFDRVTADRPQYERGMSLFRAPSPRLGRRTRTVGGINQVLGLCGMTKYSIFGAVVEVIPFDGRRTMKYQERNNNA